jgi:hypothetical protein
MGVDGGGSGDAEAEGAGEETRFWFTLRVPDAASMGESMPVEA